MMHQLKAPVVTLGGIAGVVLAWWTFVNPLPQPPDPQAPYPIECPEIMTDQETTLNVTCVCCNVPAHHVALASCVPKPADGVEPDCAAVVRGWKEELARMEPTPSPSPTVPVPVIAGRAHVPAPLPTPTIEESDVPTSIGGVRMRWRVPFDVTGTVIRISPSWWAREMCHAGCKRQAVTIVRRSVVLVGVVAVALLRATENGCIDNPIVWTWQHQQPAATMQRTADASVCWCADSKYVLAFARCLLGRTAMGGWLTDAPQPLAVVEQVIEVGTIRWRIAGL